ncbi:type IV secretory system conjugative DNA transfer family protein [Actinosynnema sp. NPDC059335]|uniref:type IV secretory system conjugative DNA transfer family protein n=1 Tax=Actinosynnema sp. NPDC059335 TaxID=3346804 RepID=UPI00366A79FF
MPKRKFGRHPNAATAGTGVALGATSLLANDSILTSTDLFSQGFADTMEIVTGTGVGVGVLVTGLGVGNAVWSRTRTARRRALFHRPGWADRHDFADVLGSRAVRAVGDQVRPSLAGRSRLATATRRNRPAATEYGQRLGKAVTGESRSVRGRRVYAGFERSVLIVAPPGAGKTALMLHGLLDAPGAALVASTKPDVYLLTNELRAQRGPVALFNPQHVGGLMGNFHWDPLVGCEFYQEATDRATALVRGTKGITGMQDASWAEKCIEILSKYLMAARLGGYDLNAVAYWLANPDNEDAVRILSHFNDVVPEGWAASLQAEMRSEADRMKASIWSLARGAVAFMSNPLIAAACSKGSGTSFDVLEFARSGGTLYLIGDDRDETIAPLLSALTTYIYEGVRKAATNSEVGRLDPPFGMFLDEVTKITPVPLAQWAADARGYGMYLTAITQSFDQLRERWGVIGAGAIMSLFSKVILGGIQNTGDLEYLSKLIGTREMESVSTGESTSRHGLSRSKTTSTRTEVIMPPQEIRMLPRGHALVIMGEGRAVVVRYRKGQVRAEKELKALRKKMAKTPPNPRSQAGPPTAPRVFGDALVGTAGFPRQAEGADERVSGSV